MAQNPNVPLAQNALGTVAYIQNASSTGTTRNKLVSLTGAPSKVVITTAGATSGVVGIVTSGAGITGTATVQVTGSSVPCVFDGSTTAGDYVQISASVNGDCADAGSTLPSSGQVLGRVLTTNSGVGTYKINLQGGGSGGGGTGTVTSAGIAAAGSLSESGTCTITTSGVCTLSAPINVVICNGSASATVATCPGVPAPTTYGAGTATSPYLSGTFIPGATSSGAPLTLNIAGIGAKNVFVGGATTSATNTVTSGVPYSFQYDGTQIQLMSGGGIASLLPSAGTPVVTGPFTSLKFSNGASMSCSPSDGGGGVGIVQCALGPLADGTSYAGSILGPTLSAGTGAGFAVSGTSLTAGAVYYNGASGLALAKADALSTAGAYCVAISTTACVWAGSYRFGSSQSWTAGQVLYLSAASGGAIVTTAPSTAGQFVAQVGFATANGTMDVVPGPPVPTVFTAAQIPAAASVFNSGTITLPAGKSILVGCTSTCTVPVPVPVAGYQICIQNDAGVTTVITLAALGSSASYPLSDHSGYGTAGTGTMVSTAAFNNVCLVGRDSTHYELAAINAAANWTVN